MTSKGRLDIVAVVEPIGNVSGDYQLRDKGVFHVPEFID